MARAIALYGLILAGIALLLEGLRVRHVLRAIDTDIYIACLAALFIGLGLWIGLRLTGARPAGPFVPNVQASASLRISPRESEILALLAGGHSNKEIARILHISPNTVKTHVSSVFEKLATSRRTQAIDKARKLGILP